MWLKFSDKAGIHGLLMTILSFVCGVEYVSHRLPGRHPLSKACLQHSQTIIQSCMWFMDRLGNCRVRVSDFSLQKLRFSALCGPN